MGPRSLCSGLGLWVLWVEVGLLGPLSPLCSSPHISIALEHQHLNNWTNHLLLSPYAQALGGVVLPQPSASHPSTQAGSRHLLGAGDILM